MQFRFILPPPAQPTNPLRKLLGLVVTVAVAIVALMFSAVFFVVIAVLGLLAWGYVWWKMREVRKQMRAFAGQFQSMQREQTAGNDDVYEGEVVRVVDPAEGK
jgi:Flp pilus assembly protein TadB